jgi:sphingomyelin phosphodiesterase acid-like 3
MQHALNRRPFRMAAAFVLLGLLIGRAQTVSTGSTQKFLIATDLHFNSFADPALVADLVAAPVDRWEGILNRSKLPAFSPYGQDTNWWLLQSTLDAMRTTLPHPALIMIDGDLLAHQLPQKFQAATRDTDPEHYRTFVLKTVAFLEWELSKRFPRVQILLTPGNNDDDCGDYQIEAGGAFLADTAGIARKLADGGEPLAGAWKTLGSYSVQLRAAPRVRILSLNSVFFSNRYQAATFASHCSLADSAAAGQTFTWLEANLAQAREAHQKVWLMFHIPPGIDGHSTLVKYLQLSQGSSASPAELCRNAIVPMWKPEWSAQFASILETYQSTIAASFAGHNHTDDFRVINAAGGNPGFVMINPPVSPIYGQNPSFRVVTFHSDGALADQSTYYLSNLTAAGGQIPGEWQQEYSFAAVWQGQPLDGEGLEHIDKQIESDPQARDQWLKLLNVSSSYVKVPAPAVKALDCAIGSLLPSTYQACACPTP